MGKQQQPKGGGGGGDSSLGPFWIIVGLGLLGFLIWHFLHEQIVIVVFKFKLYQAYLINFFNHNISPAIEYINTADPQLVSFKELGVLSETIGNYTRYPFAVIMIILAIVLYFSNITFRFKNNHNMKTLRKQEQKNWPQIKPNLDLNLIDQDINKGPWAASQTPIEFCKKHGLLEKKSPNSMQVSDPQELIVVRSGKAKEIFTLQLGRLWEGPEYLKDYECALFAIFAARANKDNNAATAFLTQINYSFRGDRPDFSGGIELLKKYFNTQPVQESVQRHAYVYTIFSTLLERARETGVLAAAEFLWLKPIDRTLWYVLNNVGRQTAFVEVAGIFSHWITEKKLGFKSIVPMIDLAVKGLEIARSEVKLKLNEF
jgi:intracellular multiplication protein IcmP